MGATAIASAADNVVAKTIYAEARGEGYREMLYIASVVYNRAKGDASRLEKKLKQGEFSPITKARHFYTKNITTPRWARGCRKELVGNHYFVEGVR